MKSQVRNIVLFSIFLLIILLALFYTNIFANSNSKSSKDTGYFLNINDTVDYVGMETCKGCHSDKHSTFVHTGMGKSFDLASLSKTSGNFKQNQPVYDINRDLYYYPFWENSKLFIQEYRLLKKDTIHSRTEEISHIIGSGQHTNSHFWSDNGFVYQAPLTYYTQKGKWDLPPGFEVSNTSFHRKIDIECMSCHNGIPKVNSESVNLFEKIPLGIDCERCHGPGELHVNEKRNGILVDTRKMADRTIVNPKRLPFSLQIDICQRCHLQGNNVLKPGKKFTDFRPGMKLSDVFEIYMPKYSNNDYFVMAGHSDRFQKSECFIKSNKTNTEIYNPKINFTCINCHDPHVSVKETKIELFNKQCKNCHFEQTTKSKLKSCKLNSNQQIHQKGCVGCHMPASGSEDIPHVLVHDHKIQRPSKSINLEKDKGQLLGLYAVNNPNPSNESLIKAYLSYFEKFDPNPFYLQKAEILLRNNQNVTDELLLAYLKGQHQAVISFSEEINLDEIDAWTCYRVAKSFDKSQNNPKALEWYSLAYNKMKMNLDFGAEYANCLIRNKEIAKAKEILFAQLKIAKKHELTHLNLASCYFIEGQYNDAKKSMLYTLNLNPDNIEACMYLVELHLKFGENDKANEYLQRVANIKNLAIGKKSFTIESVKRLLSK